jgi:hypothetical protein
VVKHLSISVLALALASAASAQTPAPSPRPVPAQLAANRAEADRIIAKTGHRELFENVSVGELARVRHKPSGAVCDFGIDDVDHGIDVIAPDAMAGARGPTENIRCHASGKDGMVIGQTVARLSRKAPLDLLAQVAAFAFRSELSSTGTVTEAPDTGGGQTLVPSKTVRFIVSNAGKDRFARREVAVIGDWNVASDFMAPADNPGLREVQGALLAGFDFTAIAQAQLAAGK